MARFSLPKWLTKSVGVVGLLAGMVLLVMWLSGSFLDRTPPDPDSTPAMRDLHGAATVAVEVVDAQINEEAVGTIRAVQEIQIASRILARITVMNVTAAGQEVNKGDLLVQLEDADLRAALAEAQAAYRSAVETRDQAERELNRTRDLAAKEIASANELERRETTLVNAKADVDRSREAANNAETMLAYAEIRSPIKGKVVDKLAETGDTVTPGQPLMTLYDPARMQLVASVREELATRIEVGQSLPVKVDSLGLHCEGQVSEVVPQAEAGSRAFDVKVVGPCPDGVFSGMFGRLLIAVGRREELRVPRRAVLSLGQIDLVWAVGGTDSKQALRRFVVLGDEYGDSVTVLSGLRAGERVVLDAADFQHGRNGGSEPR